MDFTFTDDQKLFQRTVRAFLEKECPPEHVRAMASDPTGRSPKLWKGLAELGVVGLTVPEEHGGLGGNVVDLVLLLEEAGRAALPEPLVETTAVCVPLLCDSASRSLADEWLPRVATGEAVLTAGSPLADAHVAAGVVLTRGDEVAVVPPLDLSPVARSSIDSTRRVFATMEDTSVGSDAFDRAAIATAAVLCGIADRVIEMAAAYAKERHQFGKPIGSFQAVKHLLADALLGLEFARPMVYRAAWSIATGSQDRSRDTSIAKGLASDAAVDACRAALQVHGAIGYTHEHDLHLWLNKGFALSGAWGTAAWHRDRVASAVL